MIRGNDHRPNEAAAPRAAARARRPSRPSTSTTGSSSAPDGKKISKRADGALDRVAARGGDPGRGGARLPRRARPAAPRRPPRPRRGSARSRSTCSRSCPTTSSPPASACRSRSCRRCAARTTWTRRARSRETILDAADGVAARRSARRSSASASCARSGRRRSTTTAAKAIVRELKAVGGHLRAVRRALTGRDSGPELWAVLAALPRDETLRRVDAAL